MSRPDPRLLTRAGLLLPTILLGTPAASHAYYFSTGAPDGKIAMGSRPAAQGKYEIEAADDFNLTGDTEITHATFTGLLVSSLATPAVLNVGVEIYRVFPYDSGLPPSGNVPTRANSPSDVKYLSRLATDGNMTFSTQVLSPNFTAANSVIYGIHPQPNIFTGGEGSVTGTEVRFDINFTTPIDLATNHYFFVPQVDVAGGEFMWLSSPDPIGADGTPFSPDLQTWIRDEHLAPDWLRVGTDITHQGPFNASFSLDGPSSVPEPGSVAFVALGLVGLALARKVASRA